MTPEDREKRIEAAGRAFRHGGWLGRSEIEAMLDAADRAVTTPGLFDTLTPKQREALERIVDDWISEGFTTPPYEDAYYDIFEALAYKAATGKEAS